MTPIVRYSGHTQNTTLKHCYIQIYVEYWMFRLVKFRTFKTITVFLKMPVYLNCAAVFDWYRALTLDSNILTQLPE